MVDVIEGYLKAYETARRGEEAPTPFGTRVMGKRLYEQTQALRSVPREELLSRLHRDYDELMKILESVGESDWASLMICHPYMGPVPPFCYPAFQLMDYGAHAWDVEGALGLNRGLSPDVADFLVPYMFIIMQGTLEAEQVPSLRAPVGVRVSGRNGGTWKVTVADGGVQYEQAPVDDLPTVLEFDPASFVLTFFGRIRGGTTYGDRELGDRFRGIFYST
jgi:hypothetical protein